LQPGHGCTHWGETANFRQTPRKGAEALSCAEGREHGRWASCTFNLLLHWLDWVKLWFSKLFQWDPPVKWNLIDTIQTCTESRVLAEWGGLRPPPILPSFDCELPHPFPGHQGRPWGAESDWPGAGRNPTGECQDMLASIECMSWHQHPLLCCRS
jgi:hypothetical protein